MEPALDPPQGSQPNFDHPFSIHPYMHATFSLCIIFTTFLVWMRVYTRVCIVRLHGWEDYTMITGWLLYIMYTGLTFATISRGAGVHQWDVAAHRIVSFRKLAYAQATLFLPVIFPVKCTIFLQYIRIFTPTRTGKTYKLILFVLWFNLVAYLPIQFVSFCVCVPLRKAWMPESVEGHCVNQKANFLASAVINVILDLSILVLPMWCIWRLRMPIKRKFGISAVFGVGFLACLASVMRLIEDVFYLNETDFTFAHGQVTMWTHAEIACGILCACLPVMPSFIKHFKRKVPSRVSPSHSLKPSPTSSKDQSPPQSIPIRPFPSWQQPRGGHKLESEYWDSSVATQNGGRSPGAGDSLSRPQMSTLGSSNAGVQTFLDVEGGGSATSP